MKMRILLLLLLAPLAIKAQFNLNTTNATVEFDYVSESTKGTLTGVIATVKIDPNDLANSSVSGKVPVSTLDTKNSMRNKHLKSADYFNAEKFPYMHFKTTSIYVEEGVYKLKGKLKIKDIEKEVTFRLKEDGSNLVLSTTIYAEDFGVAIKKGRDKSKVTVKVILPAS
jgi:polyisoprenoid-binding protein YceI